MSLPTERNSTFWLMLLTAALLLVEIIGNAVNLGRTMAQVEELRTRVNRLETIVDHQAKLF